MRLRLPWRKRDRDKEWFDLILDARPEHFHTIHDYHDYLIAVGEMMRLEQPQYIERRRKSTIKYVWFSLAIVALEFWLSTTVHWSFLTVYYWALAGLIIGMCDQSVRGWRKTYDDYYDNGGSSGEADER